MTSPPLALHISEDLLPSRPAKPPGITTLSFADRLHPPLQLHEDLKEGCGGQLWPAGMVLAKYLLDRTDELRGKVILELGAGGGLVGLALALALSNPSTHSKPNPPILLTDLPPLLPLQATNITLNALPPHAILSLPLPWGSPLPAMLPTPYRRPDIILAADCVYYEPAFPLLLETLTELFGGRGAGGDGAEGGGNGAMEGSDEEGAKGARKEQVCYFCMKKRRKADMRFVGALKKQFEVEEVVKGVVDGEKGVFLQDSLLWLHGREGLANGSGSRYEVRQKK